MSTDVGAEDALPNHSMASLARNGAAAYGDSVAAMFLRDGGWQSLTYDELWHRVREVALGLVSLGVERGDRVAVLANTRVEFTIADLAISTAGAIVVPVYPSNSADECEWVVGDSQSRVDRLRGRRAGGQDRLGARQPARPRARRRHRRRRRRGDDARRGRRSRRGRRRRASSTAASPPSADDDACLIIYTSGTTGRPKGVRADQPWLRRRPHVGHGRWSCSVAGDVGVPLPAAGPRLRPARAGRLHRGRRRRMAFWGGDTTRSSPSWARSSRPCCRRCRASSRRSTPWRWRWSRPSAPTPRPPPSSLGVRVRDSASSGETCQPRRNRRRSIGPTARCSRWCAASSAATSSSPSPAPRRSRPRSCEFFYAAGVPVIRGVGDDRDDVDRHAQPPRRLPLRHASAAPSPAPTCASPTTARSRWPARW